MNAKNWFSRCWQGKSGKSVALAGTLLFGGSESVLAQIVPDNTLGAESSVVLPNENIQGIQSDRIDNGAIRGANLFHSFTQFNINAGKGAYFTNPPGIENIFSRVTGANPSEIGGRLGVLGNANLFLINPRGIVFGSGASLDVQGSFLATTADAVKLGDRGLFSATQPETSNLLSVNPSAILFNTIAASPIINRSQAQSAIARLNSAGVTPGLQVQPGRTLGLVGGNLLLEGGRLTATGGRIELGSVAGVGEVSLTPSGNSFELGYDSINEFNDLLLSNRAFVDASGEEGGDIQIRGAKLEMSQSSNIWANTLGTQNGGELAARTTEVVVRDNSFMRADVFGIGTGGNLKIDTGRLLVSNGAGVTASTYGEGKGGSLRINASESIEVIGTSADVQVPSGLAAASTASGDAGDLRIDTKRLLVSDGGTVSASNSGLGRGGSLQINASESIEVIGTAAEDRFPSGLFVQSDSTASGEAGNLTIDTGRLLVGNGAQVSASTFGTGKGGSLQIDASESIEVIGTTADGRYSSGLSVQSAVSGEAGNLTIETRRLLVSDGAEVTVGTFGAGKGGSLQIHASESVEVIGPTADDVQYTSVLSAQSGSTASGDAGGLTIDTGRLLVSDGAQVSASTLGQGKGGNLQINASESVE